MEKSGPRENRFDQSKVTPKENKLDMMDDALQAEIDLWSQMNLDPDGIQHTNGALWYNAVSLASLTNLLIDKGLITQADLEYEHKKQMLIDMQQIRANATAARKEAIQKNEAIAVPNKLRLVDPKTGKEFEL